MKSLIHTLLIVIFLSTSIFSQRAKIVTEAITPHSLEELELTTNSVSSGLDIVGNQTAVYFSAKNIGNTEPITNAIFELISKPSGSNATIQTLEPNLPNWVYFIPDIKGAYQVKLTITTASGTDDTTKTIYAGNYVGVGNFAGVATQYPNCMSCHGSTQKFTDIFDRWKVSGHANIFNYEITQGAAYYRTDCMKCHTTGYDHNLVTANNGFDDIASSLGWSWDNYKPPKAGNWDTIVTNFPGLVQFATIGCENCHGPGSEHANGANPSKIQISIEAGVCAQCHDEPWRHNKYSEYENAAHSETVWSNSFAQGSSSQNNSLQNCIRCHDGRGFVNFTKGITTNTTGMIQADQKMITCASCHDPHGNDNEASLRFTPTGSDTLANGETYTEGGKGQTCMNCHKSRKSGTTYAPTKVTSSHWGPHQSVQSDVFLGKNAADFGKGYNTSPHKFALENACVDCHMYATVDTGNVNRDKVGGHSFSLHNSETDFDYTKPCENCHGPKNSFDEFMAASDYDRDGQKESVRAEIESLLSELRMGLPPIGIDSISWQDLRDSNNVNYNKAYFNYQLIENDGSKGMHNTRFAVDVLTQSLVAIGRWTGIEVTELDFVPTQYTVEQNYPNPFNPSTKIRYSLPYESNVKIKIYNITGAEIQEILNTTQSTGTYEATFSTKDVNMQLSSGVYFYTIEATSIDGKNSFRVTKKMILMK